MIETVVVDFLAASRITRLVTTDTFPPVKRLREWVLGRVDPNAERLVPGAEPPSLAELVECNWCAGFWVSAVVVVARRRFPGLWGAVAPVWATSMVVGLVAGVSEREGDLSDLGRKLDGVGLWVGRCIADAGKAIAAELHGEPVVFTELASFEPPEVPEHEHYAGEFGESGPVKRQGVGSNEGKVQ